MSNPGTQVATTGGSADAVQFGGESLTLDQLMQVSKVMATAGVLPQALRGKPADVFVTIMYGQELAMTPMQAIQGIYVVNGRPSLAGQTWLALVRRAGHRMYVPCRECGTAPDLHTPDSGHRYVPDHDETRCTVTIVRKDSGEQHTETFTWDQAVAAKLTGKDVWKSWPKRMLLWRAVSSCATVICPEVALGFELQGAEPDAEPEPVRPTLAQVAAEREDRAQAAAAPEPAPVAPDPAPTADDYAAIEAEYANTVEPDGGFAFPEEQP